MDKDQFLKSKWYTQGFNGTPNLMSHAHISGLDDMPNKLGYGYSHFISMFKDDFCEWFYDWDEFGTLSAEILKRLKDDSQYINRILDEQKQIWKKSLDFTEKIRKRDLSELSKEELVALYQELLHYYCQTACIAHLIEVFIPFDDKLKDKIQEYCQKAGKANVSEYFTALTQPIRPSFVNEARSSLLQIVKIILGNEKLKNIFSRDEREILQAIKGQETLSIIKKHQNKFYWVRCNYADGKETTIEEFIVEIKSIIKEYVDPVQELRPEEKRYETNAMRKKQVIKDLGIKNPETLQMIEIMEIMLHLQDDRKKVMITMLCSVSKVLEQLAETYHLDKKLIMYISAEEITERFLEKITNADLQLRKNGCIFLRKRVKKGKKFTYETILLIGREYEEFRKKLYLEKEEEIEELHGMCASTGTASGKVRVCRTKEDLLKFKEGEILVAPMTRPEFVQAMKKAAAIVTDEGGITAHAAIVSRELGKPCVIGTKRATRVLKDGDLVEVRANHGLVRKIK